ncbi:hypothetical protein [Sphingomonas sp.]|uniref:hypothetical protein n=1 Tax=Sphingomonas sp. TaxID=28214 RepID=UPI003B0030E9
MTKEYSNRLIDEIKEVDPSYHFDTLGFPGTFDGQINQINDLRLDRATAFYKVKGDAEPLQVETARFLQQRANAAYDDALRLEQAGKLNVRLSPQEAIGNYVDQQTRRGLKDLFSQYGISTDRTQPVRVNGREYDSSGTDLTYRRPDARVGDVAYDVTIARKTLATPQVRGFFASDFRPSRVIIIRPRQLGAGSTYSITPQGR